ncbi:MAG: UDP-N-acetylmuramate--L-alanine ligase [Syntrophomonadales bacterium]
MAVDTEKRIHLIGIGGAGMSGIAQILKEMGKDITGSDLNSTEVTSRLERIGIRVFNGHSSANLDNETDLVVFSSAIPKTNPEVKKAFRLGIPLMKRGEMLACLVNSCQGIAIAGAHGKTTTTSMLAMMLEEYGMDPSFIIGGELQDTSLGAKLGDGEYFIAEADESDASFLQLNPYVAVVTNVEDDHLDFYKSIDRLKDAFRQFVSQVRTGGFAMLFHDDPFLYSLKNQFRYLIYYGTSPEADYYFTDLAKNGWGSSFTVFHHENCLGRIELSIPGHHNVLNALAATAVGNELGIPFEVTKKTLHRFKGAKRRLQLLGKIGGIIIIDDYAHHPTEIAATVGAARQFHDGRLTVVFQPHRYTRTKLLQEHFGGAFKGVDQLIVTAVYGAGEDPIPGIDGDIICQSAQRQGCNAIYIPETDMIIEYLLKESRSGDLIVFMGAGDIWKTGEKIKLLLEGSHPSA